MTRDTSDVAFYDPDFYDLRIGPGPRVATLYQKFALEEGGPVLELGCGTADVVLAIARGGIEVWGLDASALMLERARAKVSAEGQTVRERVRLLAGRMEDFEMPQRFQQVFLSNDVVAHLLDAAGLRSTLRQCLAHLRPGGRLVLDVSRFDIVYLARFSDASSGAFRYRGRSELSDGASMQVWERTCYDVETETLAAHFRYERFDAEGRMIEVRDRLLRLRPRMVSELIFALEACGYSSVAVEPIERCEGDRAYLLKACVGRGPQ